jgi:hypothetical protein
MRTLIIDIETKPMVVHAWSLWGVNVGLNQIQEPSGILGFGYKWVGEKGKPIWVGEHDDQADMLSEAWLLLDEADVVVHFNGTSFDIPWLMREFAVAGMKPPSPFQQIDLKRAVKRSFRLESNSLQFTSQTLGLGSKVKHAGHSLWVRCMDGDPKAWAEMARYCVQDVALTEKLYHRVLPYIPSHPVVDFTGACPTCGSRRLQKRGTARTRLSEFQRWACQACGSWSRSAKRLDGADLRGVG